MFTVSVAYAARESVYVEASFGLLMAVAPRAPYAYLHCYQCLKGALYFPTNASTCPSCAVLKHLEPAYEAGSMVEAFAPWCASRLEPLEAVMAANALAQFVEELAAHAADDQAPAKSWVAVWHGHSLA